MKDLDLFTLLAVSQEMLGPLLWIMLIIIIVGTMTFLTLLVYEKRIVANRMILSQFGGFFGGILALVIMAKVSSSGFTDAGGPVDWFLIAMVFGLGFIGTTIILYAIAGWRTILARQ